MILILSLIMFILLLIIGKSRGIKTFICFFLNLFLIIFFIYLTKYQINIIFLSLILCVLVTAISLFLLNGINKKTISSFLSVLSVLLIMLIYIFIFSNLLSVQGFTTESREVISRFFVYINYSMLDVLIAIILITSIGTTIDTSISISSSLYEVNENKKNINKKELFNSGTAIGKDILSTTINTLFFVSIEGFIIYYLWNYNDSFLEIFNSKLLVQELFILISSFISSIIVIPITSVITANIIYKK